MSKQEKTLSSLNFLQRVYRHDELDSTNAEARRLIQSDQIILPSLIIAESQGKGYGRFSREWLSPPGGLYFSLVLEKEFSPQGLPLFVGICLAKAFKDFGALEVMIKWPNDLIYKGKKIAGILTEVVQERVIIGCGINTFDKKTFKKLGISGAIYYPLSAEEREGLLYHIIKVFSEEVPEFYQRGFSPFKEEWKRRSYCLNRKIEFTSPNGILKGAVKDISSSGGIIIQAGDEINVFYSGEISVKRVYGKA